MWGQRRVRGIGIVTRPSVLSKGALLTGVEGDVCGHFFLFMGCGLKSRELLKIQTEL